MSASQVRRRAPDLFEALRLEPLPEAPGVPVIVEDEASDAHTAEVVRGDAGPLPSSEDPVAGFAGLADLLEPGGPQAHETSAPAPAVTPAVAAHAPVEIEAPEVGVLGDGEDHVRRAAPWPWIAMTFVFGGTLLWVLWTQTDLFRGDLVERRKAKVAEEVAEQQARLAAAAEAQQRRYGHVKIDAQPKGARVFLLEDGPKATFRGLPADGTYVVLATAPGHAPEVRRLSGAELSVPVVFDLEPAEGAAPPIPDPGPLVPGTSKETVDLEVRVATPSARVGLLIGYTPGASMADVDTDETHRFLVTAPGHAAEEIVVGPDDFQEIDGVRVFSTHLVLAQAVAEAAGTGGDTTGAADAAGTGPQAASAGTGGEPAADPKPTKPASKRRRTRRRRSRKSRRSKKRRRK
ncbi:MAG: hypothetical protein D6705_16050 [Deltaproteobacteria bacterium]|nr:MAG: hypothetical protein D6705_16050 [Deltaproteobacteria bacterium]